MKAHQSSVGKSDSWGTPEWIMHPLGMFDLDPCGMVGRPLLWVKETIYLPEDGLSMPWHGRVWLNPPFNRFERPKWMARMAEHNNGIMLVPAACETRPFAQYVWGKASGILMLNRRPHFCHPDDTEASANSGCTICLVAYGNDNLRALAESGLGTLLVETEPCPT